MWFTSIFPGSVSGRYLVAPFWDDADTRGGNGQVYYEIHQTGHYLNQVSSFITTVRPSRFEGTWMMVVYWDAIHPFFGASNPEVKYSYTILTYVSWVTIKTLFWAGKHVPGYIDN